MTHPVGSQLAVEGLILKLAMVNMSLMNSSSSMIPERVMRLSRIRGNGKRSTQLGWIVVSCRAVGWSEDGIDEG